MEQVRDRLLTEFKNKQRVGSQSPQFRAARELLNQFTAEIKKAHNFPTSPNDDQMLAFLLKVRAVSRTDEGRVIGECKSLIDEMIADLGGAEK